MKTPGTDFPIGNRRHVGPGTRLNGIYEIDGLLATGGMGEVYRGHTVETGNRVAIKMIRPDFAENETVLALFRKEAAALHSLQHDAIVRYYVFTTDPDLRCPYLAMEFVEGESLSEVLKHEPLKTETVRILQRRLAAGLEAAHQFGVIHRDVSPDNIILPNGDPARAKIIDFGIARSAFGGQTVIGGHFAGKTNYVSPEQVGLFGGEVTAKSDIYSLGLTLVAAVRGQPFDMGGTQADLVRKRQTVPDLSEIDPALRPLLRRMLQPRPDDRPASMAEIAAWQHGTMSPAISMATANGTRKWVLPTAIASIVAVGIGIGVTGSYFMARPGGPPPENARPTRSEAPPSRPVLPDPDTSARTPPAGGSGSQLPDIPPTNAPVSAPPSAPPIPTTVLPPAVPPVVVTRDEPGIRIEPAVPGASTGQGTFRDCPTCPEMVSLPGGTFTMGSNADATERPTRRVTVLPFALGRFPVSVSEWRRCVEARACTYDPGGDPSAPVHNVSWDDAQQYVSWLSGTSQASYRLPTEAEWEYAARAGANTRYWWGDQFRSDLSTCRSCAPYSPNPPSLGRFRANPLGVNDVTGSVAQWVADCWVKDYRGAPTDGSARVTPRCRERVLRGGSWMSDETTLRLANRQFYDANVRYPGHGFRVARAAR